MFSVVPFPIEKIDFCQGRIFGQKELSQRLMGMKENG